jgi:hypothetical protein
MSEPGSPDDRAEISQPREDSLPNATRRKESLDLVDTFELFKVFFDNKLGDLKSELIQELTFDSYSLTVVQPPVEVSAMRISFLRPFTFSTKFEIS